MEKNETVYCGNGKEKRFDDGGSIVNFSVDLMKIKDHVYEYKGKKYVNLTMCANRDGENEYGKTHYIKINDFKPEAKTEKAEEPLPF
jgi:PKD repeat protein